MKNRHSKSKKENESLIASVEECSEFMELVDIKIEHAQLSLAEKKDRFKRIKENGARLTKHRFTV
ncbi:hypothetical protein V5049_11230 [Moellerella wisconsensis]|uniref:hypothetical protein n=1 Tax=Moellerella wisconsensis TaxID=158849 RepID=UPI0030764E1C